MVVLQTFGLCTAENGRLASLYMIMHVTMLASTVKTMRVMI